MIFSAAPRRVFLCEISWAEKGIITKGAFSMEESLESLTFRISREWSDSPLFSTICGFSRIFRISEFSRISRKWIFFGKTPFQKTFFFFSKPEDTGLCIFNQIPSSWTSQSIFTTSSPNNLQFAYRSDKRPTICVSLSLSLYIYICTLLASPAFSCAQTKRESSMNLLASGCHSGLVPN